MKYTQIAPYLSKAVKDAIGWHGIQNDQLSSHESDLYVLFRTYRDRLKFINSVKHQNPKRSMACFPNQGEDKAVYPYGVEIPFELIDLKIQEKMDRTKSSDDDNS